MDTPLPYTTQGSDPTVAPDAGMVVPFAEVTRSDVVLNVSSISELLSVQPTGDGFKVNVTAYHDGWAAMNEAPKGGGAFVWDSSRSKSDHNGGTVIDPDAPFPALWGDTSQQAAWFDSSNGGSGCWVRVEYTDYSIEKFGAVGDGSTDDTSAISKALDSLRGSLIRVSDGVFNCSDTVTVYDNTSLICSGVGATRFEFSSGGFATAITGSNGEFPSSSNYVYYTREPSDISGNVVSQITVNSAAKSSTITVYDASGLSVGDYIFISNGYCDQWRAMENSSTVPIQLWANPDVDLWRCEINRVAGLDGNTVTLDNPLGFDVLTTPETYGFFTDENNLPNYSGYNTPSIEKLNGAKNVSLYGFTVKSPDAGIISYLSEGLSVGDIKPIGGGRGVELRTCLKASVQITEADTTGFAASIRRGSQGCDLINSNAVGRGFVDAPFIKL